MLTTVQNSVFRTHRKSYKVWQRPDNTTEPWDSHFCEKVSSELFKGIWRNIRVQWTPIRWVRMLSFKRYVLRKTVTLALLNHQGYRLRPIQIYITSLISCRNRAWVTIVCWLNNCVMASRRYSDGVVLTSSAAASAVTILFANIDDCIAQNNLSDWKVSFWFNSAYVNRRFPPKVPEATTAFKNNLNNDKNATPRQSSQMPFRGCWVRRAWTY